MNAAMLIKGLRTRISPVIILAGRALGKQLTYTGDGGLKVLNSEPSKL